MYEHHVWSSRMFIPYDPNENHTRWSYMLIMCDHPIWSSYMMIMYDRHLWSQCIMSTCGDRTWWAYVMIIYDDSYIWSYMMITIGSKRDCPISWNWLSNKSHTLGNERCRSSHRCIQSCKGWKNRWRIAFCVPLQILKLWKTVWLLIVKQMSCFPVGWVEINGQLLLIFRTHCTLSTY